MEQETDRSVSTGVQNGRPQDSKQPSTEMDVAGKHRKQAELYRLTQEIRYLEEELEDLDKIDKATSACKEMLLIIENTPDPLLSVTKGPENPAWDRWFEGPVESDGCKCWIM